MRPAKPMPANPMRTSVALVALAFALAVLPGCLGGIQRTEWAYDDAGIDQVVSATGRTGKGVTIAILDTGINVQHPALDHLVDGDPANGELVAFRDFLGTAVGVASAFDDSGHGSHVAGIIAARKTGTTFAGVELKGAAPAAQLVVGRVCAERCDASILPTAIDWAVRQGADVVSLSLGGQFNLTDTQQRLQLENAVDGAIAVGVVIVASAGNEGAGSADVESPADIPGVIAVGSIGEDGQVSDFSSHGSAQNNVCRLPSQSPPPIPIPPLPRVLPVVISRCDPDMKPELVAPGEEIVSAWAGKDYYKASGTSQATPFVTAAVALMLEGHADLDSREDVEAVKQALVDSARPVPGQVLPHDDGAGYGSLDAFAALQAYGDA